MGNKNSGGTTNKLGRGLMDPGKVNGLSLLEDGQFAKGKKYCFCFIIKIEVIGKVLLLSIQSVQGPPDCHVKQLQADGSHQSSQGP